MFVPFYHFLIIFSILQTHREQLVALEQSLNPPTDVGDDESEYSMPATIADDTVVTNVDEDTRLGDDLVMSDEEMVDVGERVA